MKRQLHFYWFSGSGNTLRVAEAFTKRLRQLEWTVELRPLERFNPQSIEPEATLGLAFPTYFFSIPEIVLSFVRSLPRVQRTEAMMLGTHGAFSGGVVGPLKRELTAKGFRCTAARILWVPDSFFPFTTDKFNRWLLNRAQRKAECYADDFATKSVHWKRWLILSDLHGALFWSMFAARRLTRNHFSTVHVRNESCQHCGVCVRFCPVGALAVNVLEGRADAPPRPKRNCTNCLRCVAVCPTDAVRHLIGFQPYRSEKATALQSQLSESIFNDELPQADKNEN
jgi:ferredoxin